MKTVKYFDSVNDANIALSFLESEGIEGVTLNENISSVTPVAYANPSMRPYIAVRDEDFGRALELLGGTEQAEVTHCPECGSENMKYGFAGKGGRKRALKLMFVILSVLGGGPLGNIRASRFCGDCKYEF